MIEIYTKTTRFCIICNYISKIDNSLKNEFITVRFNQLPKSDIFQFIKNISEKEKIVLSDTVIDTIQQMYNSDIRSMINYIQLNQNLSLEEWNTNIMNVDVLDLIDAKMKSNTLLNMLVQYLHEISIQYNIDKKTIIIQYLNYIIRKQIAVKNPMLLPQILDIAHDLLHNNDNNTEYMLRYFCTFVSKMYANTTDN